MVDKVEMLSFTNDFPPPKRTRIGSYQVEVGELGNKPYDQPCFQNLFTRFYVHKRIIKTKSLALTACGCTPTHVPCVKESRRYTALEWDGKKCQLRDNRRTGWAGVSNRKFMFNHDFQFRRHLRKIAPWMCLKPTVEQLLAIHYFYRSVPQDWHSQSL